jgi:hypothetical protein
VIDNINLTGLAEPVIKKISPYLEGLRSLLGANLNSIIIYGSAVVEDYDPRRSNVNLVVVVEKLDFNVLQDVQHYVSRWTRKGIVAPLFLTREHMRTSSDVFPLEFLDMSDFHKVVIGDDPFAKLAINRENLRLECEEKLKGSLINLRQSYLEIADRRVPMMNLVASSITGLVSVFRGLVRLSGAKAAALKAEVIVQAADEYGFNKAPFHKALEIKHLAPRMTRNEMDAFYSSYLAEIEKLAIKVDKMAKSASKKNASSPKTQPKKKAVKAPVRGKKPKATSKKSR